MKHTGHGTLDTDLKPPAKQGMGRGVALAIAVHALLIIAIAFGVHWKSSQPEGVEAELWAAVPQAAAQRDTPPEPAPLPAKPLPKPEAKPEPISPKIETPDPQIAIEKAKQEKEKQKEKERVKREEEEKNKKKEKERREKEEVAKKQRAQEDKIKLAKAETDRQKKLDELRDKNLARIKDMMGSDGGSPGGTAAKNAGPSAGYAGRIKGRVKPNILFADSIEGNPAAEVEVRASADGTITGRKLIKSSGVKAWDDAVLRAIDKTETLPRDTDGTVPSPMLLVFKPQDF